jgi:hypothetical protein
MKPDSHAKKSIIQYQEKTKIPPKHPLTWAILIIGKHSLSPEGWKLVLQYSCALASDSHTTNMTMRLCWCSAMLPLFSSGIVPLRVASLSLSRAENNEMKYLGVQNGVRGTMASVWASSAGGWWVLVIKSWTWVRLALHLAILYKRERKGQTTVRVPFPLSLCW